MLQINFFSNCRKWKDGVKKTMKIKEKAVIGKMNIFKILALVIIMFMAGVGFGEKEVSANSIDECIVIEDYIYKEENYNIGEYEIVVTDEVMDIYKSGEWVKSLYKYDDWRTAWILDNKLYYSKNLDIYCYDFSTERVTNFMTVEEVREPLNPDGEPEISEIQLYHQSYLYVYINNGSCYDYSLIRINLATKTQETIIEEDSLPSRLLGVYNNYMYCAISGFEYSSASGPLFRISLGENPRVEIIEEAIAMEVIWYENKIFYISWASYNSYGEDNTSKLICYDVASETKETIEIWEHQSIGIRKIEDGILYMYKIETFQEIQYDIGTGKVKIEYLEPLKGVKVTHKLIYDDKKKSGIKDVCNISWDKSFTGNIEISYRKTNEEYTNRVQIKASKNKNNYRLELKGNHEYLISLKAYKEKADLLMIYSEDSKVFTFRPKEITSKDYSGYINNYNYVKRGNNLYYSYKQNGKYYLCKKNMKTGKEKKILRKKGTWLQNATNRYLYYANAGRNKLYVYDMKKNTTRKMNTKGIASPYVAVRNGKVFCKDLDSVDFDPSYIYCFNLKGSNRKKIGEGGMPFIYKNHIYWEQAKLGVDENTYYRYCRADMNGKNKKVVTKWISENDYYKIASKLDYDTKKIYLKIKQIKKWNK